MYKIVIQGASGLKNSGDEAILRSILQKMDTSCDIKVVSFEPYYSEKLHPGVRFVRMGSRECKLAVDECDLFILGGGGLLQDETSIYNVARWLKYLKSCIKKGKTTYLYANSIGPVRFGINKALIRKWLPKVNRITVRDELSLNLLKSMGISENVELTADPVFSIRRNTDVNIKRFMLPEKYVTICVRHWYDTSALIPVSICTKFHIRSKENKERYHKYISQIAWLADYIIKEYNFPVVFVPFLYGRDNKVAREIQGLMNGAGMLIEDEYLRPEEAMAIIENSTFLIGMRLHSIIYAAISGTPTCILDYSVKVRGMAKYLQAEDYMLPVDMLENDKMSDIVDTLMRNKERIRRNLSTVVSEIRRREERNQRIIDELLC